MTLRRVLILAASVLTIALAAQATPITYDFSGAISSGGSIQGFLTVDGSTVTAFSFDLSGVSGIGAVAGSSQYILDNSDATVSPFPVDSYHWSFSDLTDLSNVTLLNLDFSGLPGSLLAASSTLSQGPAFAATTFTFDSGAAVLPNPDTVPEPATSTLLLTGVLLLAGLAWIARRRPMLAGEGPSGLACLSGRGTVS